MSDEFATDRVVSLHVRQFRGWRKCLRSFIARHWSKINMGGIDLDAVRGAASAEAKAIADRTYAAQAACWTPEMPEADHRALLPPHFRILEVAYGPHGYTKEAITQCLCNELGMTIKGLDRRQTEAESIMARRYRFQGLLLEED